MTKRKQDHFWSAFLVLPLMDLPSGLPGRRIDSFKKKVNKMLQESPKEDDESQSKANDTSGKRENKASQNTKSSSNG